MTDRSEADAQCPTCARGFDVARSVETNYLYAGAPDAGSSYELVDWYPCAGCLAVLAVEWLPIRSIGDDAWAMFPTGTVLLAGAAVASVVDRLRTRIATGDPLAALADLRAERESKRLMRIPEIVEAAWPAFGGRAIAAVDLQFRVTRRSKNHDRGSSLRDTWRVSEPEAELTPPDPEHAKILASFPKNVGLAMPPLRRDEYGTAFTTRGTKLLVVGSRGPYVHAITPSPDWNASVELDHFQVTLDRLEADPDAP